MLTIREVAEKTGHSSHKIRRLIKAIADQAAHPDRLHIEPSADDVDRLTAEGVQFTWRVTEELVRRELGETVATPANEKAGPSSGRGEAADFLNLLQRVTDAKEQAEARLFEQLRVKDEQIAALNDRLRESNILMKSLQMQLPEASKVPTSVVDAAKSTSPKRPEKSKTSATKAAKRGVWARFFK